MKTIVLSLLTLFMLTGCFLFTTDDLLEPTRLAITIPSITPDLTVEAIGTPDSSQNGYYDALASTMGICFEAAWDAAGTVFTMRTAEEHIHFYDLADNSNLCRRAVRREPFDFTTGDVLVGIWNRGSGCTAEHEITSFERDDAARTVIVEARFSTEGDCSYDLVRGLWLGIENAQNYDIRLDVSN